jgi:hypothetical protein
MYYIAAECSNPTTGTELLTVVRRNRGIGTVISEDNISTEILKEYRKEFWAEGQLFFYYKRSNTPTIPNGNTSGDVVMTTAKYMPPLPQSELNMR